MTAAAYSPCFLYMLDDLTGRVIDSRSAGAQDGSRAEWIGAVAAGFYDCAPSDIDLTDTDERFDNVTVRGEIVGYVVVS